MRPECLVSNFADLINQYISQFGRDSLIVHLEDVRPYDDKCDSKYASATQCSDPSQTVCALAKQVRHVTLVRQNVALGNLHERDFYDDYELQLSISAGSSACGTIYATAVGISAPKVLGLFDYLVKTKLQLAESAVIRGVKQLQLSFHYFDKLHFQLHVGSENIATMKLFNVSGHLVGSIEDVILEDELSKSLSEMMKCALKAKPTNQFLFDSDDTFAQIGFDSLQLASLEMKLRENFGVVIKSGICLEHPTPRLLLHKLRGLNSKKHSFMLPLPRIDARVQIPLTRAQRRIAFVEKMHDAEGDDRFVEVVQMDVEGQGTRDLQQALNAVIVRNTVLRTIFGDDAQIVVSSTESFFAVANIDDCEAPSMLSGIPIRSFRQGNSVVLKFHHALIDGKSLRLLAKQFCHARQDFEAYCATPVTAQYAHYALLEQSLPGNGDQRLSEQYWAMKLSTAEFDRLPTWKRKTADSFVSAFLSSTIDADTNRKLSRVARLEGTTPFVQYLAIFRFVLYKLHGLRNLPVLTPVENRLQSDFDNTIGLFLNLSVLTSEINSQWTITELISDTNKMLREAVQHSIVPFEKVNQLARQYQNMDGQQDEIFHVMLVNDDLTGTEDSAAAFSSAQHYRRKVLLYPLMWYFQPHANGQLVLSVEYNQQCLSSELVSHLVERFSFVSAKWGRKRWRQLKICDHSLLEDDEVEQFREARIRQISEWPSTVSPIDIIREQLQGLPADKVVLKDSLSDVRALELLLKYERLSSVLAEEVFRMTGESPTCDAPVALLLKRDVNLVTALLAIWNLGLTAVPISEDWPTPRIVDAASSLGSIIITDRDDLPYPKLLLLSDLLQRTEVHLVPSMDSKRRMSTSDLLYITFTSGSTGRPKAVCTEACGVVNLIINYTMEFCLHSDIVVYQVVNPAFDIFFADCLMALCNGGTLLMARDRIPSIRELENVTHAYIMPSYLSRLRTVEDLSVLANLQLLLYGGETIPGNWPGFYAGIRMVQLFGVTEHSVYSNYEWVVGKESRLQLGRPFKNYHGFIIDHDGQPLPLLADIEGNFCSAGIGVARGYYGCEPQGSVFTNDPWTDGWRQFHTGDRVRYGPGGTLEFLGRRDNQVKISGNRVDTTEVEVRIGQLPSIKQCAVMAGDLDNGGKCLLAFVTTESAFDEGACRNELASILPLHMIPVSFTALSELPLNANGKVDRHHLRSLHAEQVDRRVTNEQPPQPNYEQFMSTVVQVFADRMRVRELLSSDDLFDKGADSLSVLMSVQELEEKYGLLVELDDVFQKRTVDRLFADGKISMADILEASISGMKKPEPNLRAAKILDVSATRTFHYPLSYNQEHMWFLQNFDQDSDAYVIQLILELSSDIDKTLLTSVLNNIIQSNAALRSRIVEVDGEPRQEALSATESSIALHNIHEVERTLASVDLSNDIPLKVQLLDRHRLAIAMHHTAVDGHSLGIIVARITQLYFHKENAFIEDNARPGRYFEFAKTQRLSDFSESLAYWKLELSHLTKACMPTEYPRDLDAPATAERISAVVRIPEDGLQTFLRVHKCSLAQLSVAAYVLLLAEETSHNELVIGVPFASRTPSYFNVVGYFANSHAVRFRTDFDDTATLIRHVQQQLFDATRHSIVPFPSVVRELKPPRSPLHHPIFQRMISFENFIPLSVRDDARLRVTTVPNKVPKFDQTWHIVERDSQSMEVSVEFDARLFGEEHMNRSIRRFHEIVVDLLKQQHDDAHKSKALVNIELELMSIWKEVLGMAEVGVDDNFFEIGGHSLLASRICAQLRSRTGLHCPTRVIFEHQTIRQMAEAIRASNGTPTGCTKARPVVPVVDSTLRSGIYPACPLQQQLLRMYLDHPASDALKAYRNQIRIRLPRTIDMARLNAAINQVVARQAVLRTMFVHDGHRGFTQQVLAEHIISSEDENDTQWNPFEKPLVRFSVKRAVDNKAISFEFDHLISDGQSMNLLAMELLAAYEGERPRDMKDSYVNFSYRFNEACTRNRAATEKFWKQELAFYANPIATDRPRPGTHKCATLRHVAEGLNSLVGRLCVRYGASPASVMLYPLARIMNQRMTETGSPFAIGMVKDMRDSDSLADVMGFFTNSLPVVFQENLLTTGTLTKTIKDLDAQLERLYEYSFVTYENLLQISGKDSLFDVCFVVDNASESSSEELHGFEVIHEDPAWTKFELTFFVRIIGRSVEVRIEYMEHLFLSDTVESILEHWISALNRMEQGDPIFEPRIISGPVCDIPLVDPMDMVMEQCRLTPSAVAMQYMQGATLTYEELQRMIRITSSFIMFQYFETTGELLMLDNIVPVIGHRSSEIVVLCLSVMYAGAAYLPIDEDTPRERIAAIVKECGAKVYCSPTNLHIAGTRWVCQPKFHPTTPSSDDSLVLRRMQQCLPSDLAYVIYTSGSTGRPKGVAIQRKGVLNMLLSATQDLCIHDKDCIYQFTNFCFDNSVLEIFMALVNGARLFIDTEPFSSDRFVQHVAKHGITHALLFPGLVETFTDEELHQMSQLRYWVTGAEKLSSQLLKKALRSGIRVVQNYGPTETTCYAMRKLLAANDHPQNLGRPISNVQVQVRTVTGEPACKMADHELWISGDGLMRGYLSRSMDDQPFVCVDGNRYYKSGDIVREMLNGEILFVGRKDGQVKLRGFRVETSEVEAVLHGLPEVQSVKVIEDCGNLIAYYVSRDKGGLSTEDLVEHCRKWLPYYMVPRAFMALDSIPLTKNSKLDKSRLPKIDQRHPKDGRGEEMRFNSLATRDVNDTHESALLLRNIFAEVLQLNRQEISVDDDFFYLGGNSINVQKLVSKTREGVLGAVTSADVYANPTIRQLARLIETRMPHFTPLANSNEKPSNSVDFNPERLPLSAQQMQMWYLSHVDADGSYVLPFVQEFSDELDPTLLHWAFLRLVQENEVLRTVVEEVNHEPCQRALSITDAFSPLSVASCKSETELRSEIERLRRQKINLRKNPPFAVRLFRLDNRYIVVFVLHHIASDATSTRLIEQEISRLYAEVKTRQRFSSKQKWRMSYASWAVKQRDEGIQELMDSQIQAFVELYGPLLLRKAALNEFFSNPSTEDSGLFTKELYCSAEIVKRQLARAGSPYVYFVHALSRSLLEVRQQHGASGENEQRVLCIGSPVHNRVAETEHILGNFLNNIVLALALDRLKSSQLSMDCVQQAVTKTLEFSELPFGEIVNAIRRHLQDHTVALYDVYLNCRYDLENEESLTMEESVRQKRLWEPSTINHPLEVDVDQFGSSFRIEVRAQRRYVSEDDFDQFVKVFEGHCGAHVSISCNANSDVVKDAFCQVLKVRNANEEDDFFAHGGNSLLLLKLRSMLSERLSVDVSVLDLLKQSSLRGIRNVVETSLAITGSTKQDEAVHMISVNRGKQPRTLYVFFAPLIGGCLSYASVISRLRNLDTDAWILGVQHPEAFKESSSPDPKLRGAFRDLCAYFDEALRSVIREINLPKDTRIVFIGASFGGSIAYEVAMLRRDVDFVVSIDGTAREREESQRITEAEHYAQMSEIMDGYDISHISADARHQMIRNSWLLMRMKQEHPFTSVNTAEQKQRVLLLKTSGAESGDYGWNCLSVELQIGLIPGDHLTMLNSANADAVAMKIVKAARSLLIGSMRREANKLDTTYMQVFGA